MQPELGGDLRRLTDHPAILGAIHFLPRSFSLAEAVALMRDAVTGRLASCGTLAVVCGGYLQGEDAAEIGYPVRMDFGAARLALEAVQDAW